jgi:hypothetical protein
MAELVNQNEYQDLVGSISTIYEEGRFKAIQAVNARIIGYLLANRAVI